MTYDRIVNYKCSGSPSSIDDKAGKGGYSPPQYDSEVSSLQRHRDFYSSLSQEEKQLIEICGEVYGGSLERMRTDLEARLAGRPHIFKLINRVRDDIRRVKKLIRYQGDNEIKSLPELVISNCWHRDPGNLDN